MDRVRGRVVRVVTVLLAVASVPGWCVAVFFVGWFWAGARHGQTCDRVHQAWCTPGYGMPQYVVVAVLVSLSSLAVLAAVVLGRGRRRTWVGLSVGASVAAFLVVAAAQPALGGVVPGWWFAA
ncbi:hypothetical protein BJ986_002935 [Phycicoccus badiiscoriae]|uniref:Uncharacterized protein n=1 Tax=Pedococcus badiiscoriae TaxID=642776 RepID=A0A852WHI6_9MICO|nr:hypothetical protein [Pedococcus badiiscoriae]NYG08448.1 hypothetical protein [Pedococcus badiiscoriae]